MQILEFLLTIITTITALASVIIPLTFPGWLLGILAHTAPRIALFSPNGLPARVLRWGTWLIFGTLLAVGAVLTLSGQVLLGLAFAGPGFIVSQIAAYAIGRAQGERLRGRHRGRRDAAAGSAAPAIPDYEIVEHEGTGAPAPTADTEPIPVITDPIASHQTTPTRSTQYAETIASDDYPIARPAHD